MSKYKTGSCVVMDINISKMTKYDFLIGFYYYFVIFDYFMMIVDVYAFICIMSMIDKYRHTIWCIPTHTAKILWICVFGSSVLHDIWTIIVSALTLQG